MNVQELDIMNVIYQNPQLNQREIAQQSGYSLGLVNRTIKKLQETNFLTTEGLWTAKATEVFEQAKPKRAIILAAGFGMRMVPINTEIPKGLIEVKGEVLIERLIRQLQEVGVEEITVVVGFMKERYEYLIDEFGVELIINTEYVVKNNLFSLALAVDKLQQTYIVPCDLWAEQNPFSLYELYSWYLVSEELTTKSTVRVNRKRELKKIDEQTTGNRMLGISYLTKETATQVREKLQSAMSNPYATQFFWETVLENRSSWLVSAKVVKEHSVIEIDTYEQLRELDSQSTHLKTDAMEIIQQALQVEMGAITNITVLKKGMTNRSFLFEVNGQKYIMRIPGEGTEQLINRSEEAAVYQVLEGKNICDDVVYMNPENGYKITKYLVKARNCDPENPEDLAACMAKLREFHQLRLQVDHRFDLFKQIDFYESLWDGQPSYYKDYQTTKENIMGLQSWIDSLEIEETLVHIDAVPDNFLFVQDGIRLIDWEYAGMQDPHLDVAMFCIYSFYNQQQADALMDEYFEGNCSLINRAKIYAYMAIAGLLWSNWCEYKRNLGIDFGEYSLRQYRYAKEFYKLMQQAIAKLTEEEK